MMASMKTITRTQGGVRASVLLCALLGFGGCAGADSVAGDVSLDVDDTAQGDAPTDTVPGQLIDVDSEPPDFLDECDTNQDCVSGWCVPTSSGNRCSKGCGAGCPPGWECGPVVNNPIDVTLVCLDRTMSLCHPCRTDADCNRFTAGGGHRCLDYGDAGRFCGMSCRTDLAGTCPDGYECSESAGVGGQGQCVPTAGECECNELARELELSTDCGVANAIGRCEGVRVCTEAGLSACSARTPAPETCNGIDDDCNGIVDDGLAPEPCQLTNAHGSCPGTAYCIAGQTECLGVAPRAEECNGKDDNCNGLTDEGFPDLDGDGIADCVDPDIDGDGAPNVVDCAPYDPTIFPGQVEQCNGQDDNCNGLTDEEDALGCTLFYRDVDGDTFGSDAHPPRCLCGPEPATYYTATVAGDCDDLEATTYPGAPEVCNGKDNNCNDVIDDGVQAPCGGCVNICLVESGPGTDRPFAPGPANAHLTGLDANGSLVLLAGETMGTYRHIVQGWPQGNTRWTVVFAEKSTPGGVTAITLRYRTAATEGGLGGANWSSALGPFPPATFPSFITALGAWIELEVTLEGTAGSSPRLDELTLLGERVP